MKFVKYPNNLRVVDVKAKIQHRCDICKGTIEPSEVYTHIKSHVMIGGWKQWPFGIKACLHHDVNLVNLTEVSVQTAKTFREFRLVFEVP